ncbi:hypothetical protein Y032_1261g3788, partial [Ancylostoma ceylanicum]
MRELIFLFLISPCYAFSLATFWDDLTGQKQSVGVKGRLLCKGKPAQNVYLELWERDSFSNWLLKKAQPDARGYFKIWGTDTEPTVIEPDLKIKHECRPKN